MRNHPKLALLALLANSFCFAAADLETPARSLLATKCQICHNDQASAGGLSVATIAAMLKGGKRGTAIVPGHPEQSLLYRLISGGGQPKMPLQGEPLTTPQIESVKLWIEQGAPWSDAALWWSLKPLKKPEPSKLESSWIRNPIDAFVLAKLNEKKLEHSPEADRRTLIRRLTYDLHGLPPSPEEVDAFITDSSANAYEKLVDRLLASPRYGERWGRHWLDAAHYGESHGYDKDKPRRNAWPYRDYVIQSFNEDKPYSTFVQEQLAGDVLDPDNPKATVALGFLAAGPWDLVGQSELREDTSDKKLTRLLDRDDMVTVTMSTLVSMTTHCARCHNHKFDPIPQQDYYNLQAVFAGVDRADRPYDSDPEVFRQRNKLLAARRALDAGLRPLDDAAAVTISPAIEALDKQVAEWKQISATDPASRPPEISKHIADAVIERAALVKAALPPESLAEMDRLHSDVAVLNAKIAALPKAQTVYAATNYFPSQGTFRFAVNARPVNVLTRGSVDTPGVPAIPGALSCVSGLKASFPQDANAPEGLRRAALARWVTDPSNMLAWRSIVNRVWHYHFGAGLVDSPNDFGRMGSQPTHPELLDYLAVEFRDSGGSFKKLHKLIVMSSVYRQTSTNNAANDKNDKIDADNRYLWRANRQRLDAESLRDAILAATGKLDLRMGGPSDEQFFFKDDHSPVYDYARFDPDSPTNFRRSIYRFVVRSAPDPFMERFDCPDISMVSAKRSTTITSIQALALLNNPFVLKQAEHLAGRVQKTSASPQDQVRSAFRLTLQRQPDAKEQSVLENYLSSKGLQNLCRLLLNTNEFVFID